MKNKLTDRLVFLAEMFDIFPTTETEIEYKMDELRKDGYEVTAISYDDVIIALVSIKTNQKNRMIKKVSVSSDVFSEMISVDPTSNKMFVQWMLNLFSRFIKDDKTKIQGIRLVGEDLPQAEQYLLLFEDNKRKKRFKDLCEGSYLLKGVSDPTDINQYKSLIN